MGHGFTEDSVVLMLSYVKMNKVSVLRGVRYFNFMYKICVYPVFMACLGIIALWVRIILSCHVSISVVRFQWE